MCIINEKITVKCFTPALAPPLAHENNYSTQINYCYFMIVFREEYEFQPNACTKCLLVLVCDVSHFISMTDIFSTLCVSLLRKQLSKVLIISLEYLLYCNF